MNRLFVPGLKYILLILSAAALTAFLFTHREHSERPSIEPVVINNDRNEKIFRAGPYFIRVSSFTDTAPGAITIFPDSTLRTPTQTITLDDPNMWTANDLPIFFKVNDINFDGYPDFGFPPEGGAKWASYTYWIFNPRTKQFETTALTNEFSKIKFNDIIFDAAHKTITTDNFYGAWIPYRTVYTVENNHLKLLEEDEQHQKFDAHGEPLPECETTIKKYTNGRARTTIQKTSAQCTTYYELR